MKQKLLLMGLSVTLFSVTASAQNYIGVDSNQPVPLVSEAGTSDTICTTAGVTLGGSPTAMDGTGPYTYLWDPATGLSSATDANPSGFPTATTTYYVTVTDSNNCESVDSITITVDPCTGVEEFGAKFGAIAQPNPTSGIFQLKIGSLHLSERIEITVMDQSGKLAHNAVLRNISGTVVKEINLENYPAGMYLVNVTNGEKVKTLKINKQ